MPRTLITAFKKGRGPLPKGCRKMVRIIIDCVEKVCAKPLRRRLAIIANKVVEAHPASYKDIFYDTLNSSGYDSPLN